MNTELAYPHVAVGYHLIARVTTDTLAYDGSVTTRSGHRVVPSCVATRMDRVLTCFPAVWVRVTTNLPAFSSNRISHLQPGCRVAYAIAPPHSTECFRCSARKRPGEELVSNRHTPYKHVRQQFRPSLPRFDSDSESSASLICKQTRPTMNNVADLTTGAS